MGKTETPICHSCTYAWRAPQGYIRGCMLHLNESSNIQAYGKCAEASATGECTNYQNTNAHARKDRQ